MHKGVIILTKANDKYEALDKVTSFLEQYENDVWDWYQVGGRWSNTLAPKHEEFTQWANEFLKQKEKKSLQTAGFISQNTVNKYAKKLQQKWKQLGMLGENPYSDHYQLPDGGSSYDVMPLSDCLEVVKQWVADLEQKAEEYYQKMQEAREKEKMEPKSRFSMSSFYANGYADATDRAFCFDSNVYDATVYEGEKIPEDITNYWAVMIDMHS